MTPNNKSARSGRTIANSTSVCPSELRSDLRGVFIFMWVRCRALVVGSDETPEPTRGTDLNCLDRVGDAVDHGADVPREEADRGENGERDHGQDHGVLRHRLTLLVTSLREERLHVYGELKHALHLPSRREGARRTRRCR